MHKLLAELEAALQSQSPPLTAAFAKPATRDVIRRAEEDLGVPFPKDLREFLLCADGQRCEGHTPVGDYIVPRMKVGPKQSKLSAWGYLLSVKQIVEQTRYHRERGEFEEDERGRRLYGPVTLHHEHLIITDADAPAQLALDPRPAEGGHIGQVVTFNDQPDYTACLAPSLSAFLRLLIDGFRAGRFRKEEDGTLSEVRIGRRGRGFLRSPKGRLIKRCNGPAPRLALLIQ